MKKLVLSLLVALSFAGCVSSNFTYYPSSRVSTVQNWREVDLPKDSTWTKLIRGIATTFFVINNVDKSSGLINVSYSGDPEKYVDGGELSYDFSNMRGARNYRFPATRASASFETMYQNTLYGLNRTMSLDGRMNILVSEVAPTRTRVTVNVRYVLTKTVSGQSVSGQPYPPESNMISFNTGQSSTFNGVEYRSTGELEAAVLGTLD
jgi:hypothetical protein